MRFSRALHCVDAHCQGEATRVVVGGVLEIPGASMDGKRAWLQSEGDELRRTLLFEPRGSSTMSAVLLLAACEPGHDFGLIIMEGADYPPMSGTNTINAATVALETGIVPMVEPLTSLRIETPAGVVAVQARCREGKVESVSFDNVPCFVTQLDAAVEVAGLGTVTVDVAWGGHFFAFVSAPEHGFVVEPSEAQGLAQLGERIKSAAGEQLSIVHPRRPELDELGFVVWIAPPRAGGDGRNATVVSPGRLDRSPCGTATGARLAVLAARGELADGVRYRHESILSTTFTAEIVGRAEVGGVAAVIPRITGSSWIHAVTQIGVDPSDPFPTGYTLPDVWGTGPTARF